MKRLAALWFAVPLLAQEKPAKVDFERQILPILERRCVECHSARPAADGKPRKPKGGVVLDTREGLQTSKRGNLAIAGKPADSLLVKVTTLPADDEDRMPPEKSGDPLSKAQTDLLELWIAQGADCGAWTGKPKDGKEAAGKPKDGKDGKEPAARPDPFAGLQKGLAPLSADVLARFQKGPFAVASLGDQSPLLRVSCCGQSDLVDDAAVAELLPLADHIADLDLARSRVGDAACATLAKMPRLVALDLRQTQVGNHGVAALTACQELRSLNLFGTKVGDYGVTALATLKHLEELYVWQTEVTANAVVRLRESLPNARVVVAADLPEPMTGAPAGGRKRPGK